MTHINEPPGNPGRFSTANQSRLGLASPKAVRAKAASTEELPTITPVAQFDLEVYALEKDDKPTGDVGVRNDTSLYYSVRMLNRETGDEVLGHATSWLDPRLVQPQDPLISVVNGSYAAKEKEDFHQPRFRDVDIDLVKSIAGGSGGASFNAAIDTDPAIHAATRTILSQIMTPWLSAVLGLPGHVFFDAICAGLYYYPSLHMAVASNIANGDYAGAARLILSQIVDDVSQRGPIYQVLAGAVADPELLRKVALKHLTPYLNIISVVLDLGSTASDTSKALYDLATIPAKVRFAVEWPLRIHDIKPDGDANSWAWVGLGLPMRMTGTGFWYVVDTNNVESPPLVHIKISTGEEEFLSPTNIDPDGISLVFPGLTAVIGGVDSHGPGDTMEITVARGEKESQPVEYEWREVTVSCPTDYGSYDFTLVGWQYFYYPGKTHEQVMAEQGCF